ncbi:phytoene synthase [Hasllibacter halocynthiae]|uniref:Phytoene synthase n=1 Tax=Hasllibacter halocynthiae TaxID=595589 RepID=A0A2T0X2U7_9RHOB|nr:phytoene/squalene synthase family protein [Hasllibacter halocynthiae]PRY93258.1 phytoene synthase [Hasllibacter halocynthiae]
MSDRGLGARLAGRAGPPIDGADLAACREAIRAGSLSFHSASRLLPRGVRDPALALYAFCRLADDAVDEGADTGGAVLRLRARLDAIYDGRPEDAPADRAFAAVVQGTAMPRALPEALLEGLAWDAVGREYRTLSDLHAYGARVAGAVGAMMCVLMGVRDRHALSRACDLGAAMQLTNIARDVGEDAAMGRVYLPLDWLEEAGVDRGGFLADPLPTDAVRAVVGRLLGEARRLYFRAEAGIAALPRAARPGIWAARLAYAGIGGRVAANGHDSVSRRAVTSRAAKLGWLAQAGLRTGIGMAMPRSAVLYAAPLPEAAFLVDAACGPAKGGAWGEGRGGALLAVLAQLEAQDRAARLAAE